MSTYHCHGAERRPPAPNACSRYHLIPWRRQDGHRHHSTAFGAKSTGFRHHVLFTATGCVGLVLVAEALSHMH
eukprot:9006706-Alexandrium_andersonii.AAC.1